MNEKPRLLITRRLPGPVESRAAARYALELTSRPGPFPIPDLLRAAADRDGLLISLTEKMDAAALAELPGSVRIIATYSVGLDHIDLQAAARRGVIITNTPDVLTDATAEIAVLLTLGACRRAGEGERMIREGRWGAWSPTGFLGTDLNGKSVGILGLGRIGQAIAGRLAPFRVALHYHNRRIVDPSLAHGARYCRTLGELFAASEILIVAAASTPETRGIINAAALAALPKGAFLINVARGDLVDEPAVFEALERGHLAGVGMDVYRDEPSIDPRWRQLESAFLLPHLGSATLETRIAMGMRALDNLDDFFDGRRPRDQVVP
jgi:glyoxylate reductase